MLKEIIHKQLMNYVFKQDMTFWADFVELAEEVLNRIEEEHYLNENEDEAREAVYYAMNDEMIYTEDQWKMMELYCTP